MGDDGAGAAAAVVGVLEAVAGVEVALKEGGVGVENVVKDMSTGDGWTGDVVGGDGC